MYALAGVKRQSLVEQGAVDAGIAFVARKLEVFTDEVKQAAQRFDSGRDPVALNP